MHETLLIRIPEAAVWFTGLLCEIICRPFKRRLSIMDPHSGKQPLSLDFRKGVVYSSFTQLHN
ncbi:MAG TPA: hypothetical protein ENG90_00360 [Gammaproteobacteria bacterium]|nr:hypothetical protein [Gammaproteobacteria bacterium]HDZ79374.1 hypothetical protein [Gammaproteobacteria bacterium]